jgi:Chlamydia polymorphic membrane protein (Chlamydia_PMP) repeat
VSWTVLNSVFRNNEAVGTGANPARGGTPGGGSGGAIYNDGDDFTLSLAGSLIADNHAKEGGGAVFFVSNDRTGTLDLRGATLKHNPSAGFETDGLPGVFFLGRSVRK